MTETDRLEFHGQFFDYSNVTCPDKRLIFENLTRSESEINESFRNETLRENLSINPTIISEKEKARFNIGQVDTDFDFEHFLRVKMLISIIQNLTFIKKCSAGPVPKHHVLQMLIMRLIKDQ
jgi:hypothetical protein